MNKENIFKSICWDITAKCNDHCNFCYRNIRNSDLSFEDNKKILKKMIDFGVDKISFVGGEPLLYDGIIELLQWGQNYSQGNTIFSITTNGILLSEHCGNKLSANKDNINKIMSVVDWITFSLDASNSVMQYTMGRNKQHFDRTITLIDYLNNTYRKPNIKINTVVSRINCNDLKKLFEMLLLYNIKRWKLFRFLPSRGPAALNKDNYWISDKEFTYVTNELKRYNRNQLKITINGHEEFDNSYVTISSSGKLIVYDGDYYEKVDVLNEPFENVLKYIDLHKHANKRTDFRM